MFLEETFNVVEHSLDHLFMPWVHELNIMNGKAEDYVDTPFVVDAMLQIEGSEFASLDPSVKPYARSTMNAFLDLLGISRRRRTT